MKAIINGKTCIVYDVYETKKAAFDRAKTIANNTKVYKTDDGKYALYIFSGQDISQLK